MKNTMIKESNKVEVENKLLVKRMTVINEVVRSFEAGENKVYNCNVWAYGEDTLRTALPMVSNFAAMPLNDWAKYTEVILSNKKLYLVGLTQHMDVVRKKVVDLKNDIEALDIYSNNNEETLSLKIKGEMTIQLKGNKEKFTKLYTNITEVYGNLDNVKYHKDEKGKKPFGFKALVAENLIYAAFGLAGTIALISMFF